MRRWQAIGWLCVGAVVSAACSSPLIAGERCQAFVEGLRGREYYDLALEYIASMRTSPLADPAFREVLDFEQGVTLVDAVRLLPAKERERQLDEAAQCFRRFVREHPRHLLVPVADRQLAEIELERGQAMSEQARQSGKSPEEKAPLFVQARQQILTAQKALNDVDVELNKIQKRYKDIDKDDTEMVRERDRIRAEIMLARLSLAKSIYSLAQTYEPGSKQRNDLLLEAAKKYGEYYAKYDRWLIRYSYRMEEARCYREAGDFERAIDILEEAADMDPIEEEAVRRIRTAATVMQMQTYLLSPQKRYGEAWRAYENWANNTQRPAENVAEAAVIKCLAGEAALELARGVNANDKASAPLREEYLRQAKQLLTFAAGYSSELEAKARPRLMDPLLAEERHDTSLPKTYDEARDRAILAAARLREPKIRSNPPPQLRDEALRCLQFALAHRPLDAPLDELNILRSCLAEICLMLGDDQQAAVVGEFLANHYGDRSQGQAGAKIALLAWDRLASEASREEERTFASLRMRAMVDLITSRWPNSATADDARILLARAEMNRNHLDIALAQLGQIRPESIRRGEADIIVGQMLWQRYRDTMRLPEEQQPPAAEMARRLLLAQKALQDGIPRVFQSLQIGDAIPYPLVAAVLSLSQIQLELGQADVAVKLLDDSRIGPALVGRTLNNISRRGNFQVESLTTAVRAYAATKQFAKAEQALAILDQNRTPSALLRIYIQMARQMEDTLKRANAGGTPDQIASASQGLDFLLTRIATRPVDQSSFESLYWCAETYMRLGEMFDAGGKRLPTEAAVYFGKAVQTYEKLVTACVEVPNFAPRADAMLNVRVRLARCLRRLGQFEQSVNSLAAILQQRPSALDVQCEIAATYQQWGQTKPEAYMTAIRGLRLPMTAGPEVLVWGWGGIASRVQASDAHQDVFYQARYNLALCRTEDALTQSGDERQTMLRRAEQDILVVQRLRPALGGKKWYNQYDELLRRIQQSLGIPRNEQGLHAAEQPNTASGD